jgi:hypothetical protein
MVNYTITRNGFTFSALSTPPNMVKWELTDEKTGELIDEALMCAADWADDQPMIERYMNQPGLNPRAFEFTMNGQSESERVDWEEHHKRTGRFYVFP